MTVKPTQTPPTIQRDKLIIVDVEATCWSGPLPPGQQNEIIEIGVCVLDVQSGTPIEKRSILVKPVRSRVSDFCTELTTLTQAQVDAGMTFAEACAILENNYAAKSYVWGSWGMYDKKIFQKQCESFGVEYPFSNRHVNLKKLFGKLANNRKQMGMMNALKHAHLEPEGTHHRGDDDAWNIARIVNYLFKEYGRGILLEYW